MELLYFGQCCYSCQIYVNVNICVLRCAGYRIETLNPNKEPGVWATDDSRTLHKFSTNLGAMWRHEAPWSKFHAKGPHFYTVPWNSLLSVTDCLVHLNWYIINMRDCRLPAWLNWILPSCGLLRCMREFETDVSGRCISSFLNILTLEDGRDIYSRNVCFEPPHAVL